MVKPMVARDRAALGRKHRCPGCSRSFYDLGKRPAVCPRCESTVDARSRPVVPGVEVDEEEVRQARKLAGLSADEVARVGVETLGDALAESDDGADVDLTADDDDDSDD